MPALRDSVKLARKIFNKSAKYLADPSTASSMFLVFVIFGRAALDVSVQRQGLELTVVQSHVLVLAHYFPGMKNRHESFHPCLALKVGRGSWRALNSREPLALLHSVCRGPTELACYLLPHSLRVPALLQGLVPGAGRRQTNDRENNQSWRLGRAYQCRHIGALHGSTYRTGRQIYPVSRQSPPTPPRDPLPRRPMLDDKCFMSMLAATD